MIYAIVFVPFFFAVLLFVLWPLLMFGNSAEQLDQKSITRTRPKPNDALIPEIWSLQALATLMSNVVMSSLVHRDFDAKPRNTARTNFFKKRMTK